ncbi:MAG: hypothetical protein GY939_11495 [Actinomycetia bacterium]|nr:hypothetical protein [Actinomycetes bacterium]
MHTLLFHEAGHFHAALLLRVDNPRLDRNVHVYATPGPDVDRFAQLVEGFNQRQTDPTNWNLTVHTSDDPLAHLIHEQRGQTVVVAGPNAPKLAVIRRLHDAGLAVLADKPWITTTESIPDLDRVTAGPPLVVDLMTGRHNTVDRLRRLVVATSPVFGGFVDDPDRGPALESKSIHHLCKTVDGRPLHRPEWYYDVAVQGDGLVDIQSHLVDQAQWLTGAVGPVESDELDDITIERAERWSTPVPLALYTESTGADAFAPSLLADVDDGVLALRCNGQLDYKLRGLRISQRTEWEARQPDGGGDTHWAVARGSRAIVTVRLGPQTGYRPEIHVGPSQLTNARTSVGRESLAETLVSALDQWRVGFAGLDVARSELGYQLIIPPVLETPHEATFAIALDEFLDRVEAGSWSAEEAETIRARYTLLAEAHDQG